MSFVLQLLWYYYITSYWSSISGSNLRKEFWENIRQRWIKPYGAWTWKAARHVYQLLPDKTSTMISPHINFVNIHDSWRKKETTNALLSWLPVCFSWSLFYSILVYTDNENYPVPHLFYPLCSFIEAVWLMDPWEFFLSSTQTYVNSLLWKAT